MLTVFDNRWFIASAVAYCLLLLISISSISDYGMSWDEHFRFQGGDAKLEYYEGLFAGRSVVPPGDSYPGLFDLPLALAHKLLPDLGSRSEKGHLYSLFFGLMGVLSVWRTAACLGGERAGFWALLLIATLPRYYGHMFFNPKDIPLAGTYMFGVWALVSMFSRLPELRWRDCIWVGVAAGLSMSTRIAGFLILFYFGLFALIYLALQYRDLRSAGTSWCSTPYARDFICWGRRGFFAGLIACIILFVFWPALHLNPLDRAVATVENVQSFGWSGKVLMEGYFWDAYDLPFYYIPYWIIVSIPDVLMLVLGVGFVLSLLKTLAFFRSGQGVFLNEGLPVVILVFSFLFPLIYLMVLQPTLYDGARHFLFIIPSLVALAGLSFEWFICMTEKRFNHLVQYVTQSVFLLIIGLTALQMWQLHPYQYTYFNLVSGGLPAAYMRDETDYWGLSHKEAGDWLNTHVEELDPAGEKVFIVHQRYSRWMLQEALNPMRFKMTPDPNGADFFVSVTRFNLHSSYPHAELIHVVERKGVPLCFIYRF